jgi:hypothetical protein
LSNLPSATNRSVSHVAVNGQPASPDATVTLGTSATAALIYADPRMPASPAPSDLSAMLDDANRKAQAVIDLIVPMLKQQGLNVAAVASGAQHLQIDPPGIATAKAAIADDGEFGVSQVAQRILGFAKSVIGDDPAKLATVRAAVEQGFQQAGDALGGALPEISQQTHQVIMAEFDRWEKAGIPVGSVVTLGQRNDRSLASV